MMAMGAAMRIVAAGVAALLPAAAFDAGGSGARSFHRPTGGRWEAAAFVCDGVASDRAYVLARRGGGGVTLWRYRMPGLAARGIPLRLGAGDAGMSQLVYPLLGADGREAAAVHLLSPAAVEPGATTPTVTWVRVGGETTDCRFAPQTRVLGVGARRSIEVVALPGGGYRYTAYTHGAALAPRRDLPWGGRDSEASLTIGGGRLLHGGATRVYVFAHAGYTYRVIAGADPSRPGGGVEVVRGGRVVLREAFGAYTVSARG